MEGTVESTSEEILRIEICLGLFMCCLKGGVWFFVVIAGFVVIILMSFTFFKPNFKKGIGTWQGKVKSVK